MPSIEELETRAGCKVKRPKNYKEADDADIGALFPEVMKNCGDKLAEYMCDDLQTVAALAPTCVGALDASKSWRLLGHADNHKEDITKRLTEVGFSLFAAERDACCRRWLARAAAGDVNARGVVAKKYLGHKHCACEETQVVIPSCAESPEGCLELCRDLFETLGATTENVYGEEVGYVGPAPHGARRAPGPARPRLPRRRARQARVRGQDRARLYLRMPRRQVLHCLRRRRLRRGLVRLHRRLVTVLGF